MTTWRTWCIIWAIVWFVAGFLFLPLWILSLMSVGAALIPWGGDSR
jgi:ABC-type spermidine/putrescine transport system permease subunit II